MLKLLIVVLVVAVAVYAVSRAIERRGVQPVRPRRAPRPRAQGPDDDPDFLRELDRRRRREAQDEGPDPAP